MMRKSSGHNYNCVSKGLPNLKEKKLHEMLFILLIIDEYIFISLLITDEYEWN